jgi:hypothetical protein
MTVVMRKYSGDPHPRRHGSAYIAVLGVCLIVMTLAVGGILATRVRARAGTAAATGGEARVAAQSSLELARLWINQDSDWRNTYPKSPWSSSISLDGTTVSIALSDPIDGDLTNRPNDPVVVTATATRGQARCVLRQTLTAAPVPLPALAYSVHGGGQIRIASGLRLILGNGTVSTNNDLRNDSVIEGNANVTSCSAAGVIYGMLTTGSAAKALPEAAVPAAYAKLGTQISPNGGVMDGKVLSPGVNPWGTPNPDGVYVVRSGDNLTIRNTRVNGTLVVLAHGKTVTIDGPVLFQNTRADYPALIVDGDLVIQYSRSASGLSESAAGVNFNPPGAPYQGVSDADTSDTYPAEMDGLVHVTGTLFVSKPYLVRGAVIAENPGGEAMRLDTGSMQVVYDPSLYTSPPQFYTTSVPMVPLAGSVVQVVQ